MLYVISHFVKYGLACRWFNDGGYTELAIYFVAGTFAESIERSLIMYPMFVIMAKVIPKGVESSMMALNTTIMNMSMYIFRSWFGVIINDNFVHVTKKSLDDYKYLCLIGTLSSIIPLTFIWFMTPTIK